MTRALAVSLHFARLHVVVGEVADLFYRFASLGKAEMQTLRDEFVRLRLIEFRTERTPSRGDPGLLSGRKRT